MSGRNFAFFTVPADGHVNPMLAVAGQVANLGGSVALYVNGEYQQRTEAAGVTFRSLKEADLQGLERVAGPVHDLQPADQTARFLIELSLALLTVPMALEQMLDGRPDHVVYDPAAVWGRCAARILGIPASRFLCTYALAPSSPSVRTRAAALNAPSAEVRPAQAVFAAVSRWYESEFGQPAPDPTSIFSADEPLNIITLPRAFQQDAQSFDGRHLFAGPCLPPTAGPSVSPEDRPLLALYAIGSVLHDDRGLVDIVIRAFRNTSWDLVMSIGTTAGSYDRNELPPNVTLEERFDQLALLPRARVMITHGGMNSVMEAIWMRVPVLVLPRLAEHDITARRVQELGVGLSLAPDRLDVPSLIGAVEKLLDERYRKCVEGLRRECEVAGGAAGAAEVLLHSQGRLQRT